MTDEIKMTDSEKERNLTLRNEYAGLLVRFNSTQTLRFVPIAGYFALQPWLINLLTTAFGKFSSKPHWIEAVVIFVVPFVAGIASGIANAFEGSFTRGLTETIDRGMEIEDKLQVKGIFTKSRESHLYAIEEGETMSSAMNTSCKYLVIFWALSWSILSFYVIMSLR